MSRTVAFDTETFPIRSHGKAQTLVCPRMVCLSWYDGEEGGLLDHEDGALWFVRRLRDDNVELVGHNVAYDLAVGARAAEEFLDIDVAAEIFDKLESHSVHDTKLNDKLKDIATGGLYSTGHGYHLADLVEYHLGEEVEGKDDASAWRTRYNELFGEPIDEWPTAAREYAKLDAEYTYRVWNVQEFQSNEPFQTATAFATHLISCHGAEVDGEYAAAVDAYYARQEEQYRLDLIDAGLIVDGTLKRNKKRELIADAWDEVDESPNLTPKGNVKTDKDTIRELQEKGVENPTFESLLKFIRAQKFRSTWLEPILDAAEIDQPLCPRYFGLVNSGRTSSSGPNIQNFPARTTVEEDDILEEAGEYESQKERVKDGVVVGPDIRGCLVPREGKVLVAADYSSLEMATLAQVIRNVTGEVTKLGQAINEGKDLHLMVASTLTGEEYEACEEAYEDGEKWIQRPRRVSKVINYARPVGAGAETIKGQLRQQGVSMTIGEIERAIADWNDTWPDMRYFEKEVQSFQSTRDGPYWVEQHGPRRMTSGWRLRMVEEDEMSAAMNTLFQGLAADGAKLAGLWLQRRCWDPTVESVLYDRARVWAFIHDEYVLEVDREVAEEAGDELSNVMEDAMDKFVPDIRIEAEPEIFHQRWQK